MRATVYFVAGMLAAAGFLAVLVLGRHPLARYAFNQAVQQDVAAAGRVLWH